MSTRDQPPPPTSGAHKWEPSRLGHGESVCAYCHGTNREIAVIGNMNVCEKAPPSAPNTPETILLREFFDFASSGSHYAYPLGSMDKLRRIFNA